MAESTQVVKLRKGATSQIFYVELRDSAVTTGALKGAIVFGGLTADKIEWSVDAAIVALTPEDIAALGTWATPTSNAHIRFKETAGLAGLYEVQVHDDWVDVEGRISLVFQAAATMVKRIDIVVEDTAKEDTVQAISTTGVTLNAAATARVLTGGTTEVGVFGNTEQIDGSYHEINDNAGTTDMYYEFQVGADGVPTGVRWTGYMFSNNDDMDVYAYNWGGTAFELIGNIDGKNVSVNEVAEFTLFPKYVQTTPGSDLGKVRIRFEQTGLTSSELQTDQIIVQYAVVNRSVGYGGGSIWVDTVNGVAGTTDFINGTADNPVLTWADALTLSASLGMHRFRLISGSSVTLTGNSDNFVLEGHKWSLDLNGQSIVNLFVDGADVVGTGTGAGWDFNHCEVGTVSLADGHMHDCALTGDITATAAATYYVIDCVSGVAGTATPSWDFGGAIGNTNLNLRDYSGGIEIKNIGANGTDTMSLEGDGQLVLNANCALGTIAIRGHFPITDNVVGGFVTGGGVISDDARFTRSAMVSDIWSEDITAIGTASSAALLLTALNLTGRTFNNTLNALLGVPDTAGFDVPGQVWEEVAASHVVAGTTGAILSALGGATSVWDEAFAAHVIAGSFGELAGALNLTGRTNNATLDSLLGVPDVATKTMITSVWEADITTFLGSADYAGRSLHALGHAITARANNPTLNGLLGVVDSATADIAWTVLDEVTTAHTTANSVSQRLQAMDVLTEAGGNGDLAAIKTSADKVDSTAASGSPFAGSLAHKLDAITTILAAQGKILLASVNLQGTTLHIEAAVEVNGIVDTATYTRCQAQIFNEAGGIITGGNISIGDFGAKDARGFFAVDVNPHGITSGATFQINIIIDDGAAEIVNTTKPIAVIQA